MRYIHISAMYPYDVRVCAFIPELRVQNIVIWLENKLSNEAKVLSYTKWSILYMECTCTLHKDVCAEIAE